MSDPAWIGAGIGTAVGTATITTGGVFTIAGHGLSDGQPVRLDTLTGGASAAFAEGTTYYVVNAATDTFSLVSIPGDTVITLGSSGGADVHTAAPHYSAVELRRLDSGLLVKDTADRFGARQGIHPANDPAISVSGTTWTVESVTGVVYPGLSSDDGPYRFAHPSESGSLDPADGTNNRIDALDLQIQDDDEDASGQRRVRVVYVTGTPASSPAAPTQTSNSLRLGTILVPAGGSPSPSVSGDAEVPFTVAAGGVLPVRTAADLPSSGLYDGLLAWVRADDTLRAVVGGSFSTVLTAGLQSMAVLGERSVDGLSDSADFDNIDTSYQHLVLLWHGGHTGSGMVSLMLRINGESGSTSYRSQRIDFMSDTVNFSSAGDFSGIRVGGVGELTRNAGLVVVMRRGAFGINGLAPGVAGSNDTSVAMGGGTTASPFLPDEVTRVQLWPSGQTWDSPSRMALLGVKG